MKIKFFLLFTLTIFLLSGCTMFYVDPYVEPKFGNMAVDAWFNEKDLGKLRKKADNIDEIVSRSCEFIESKKNKYVFKCKLTVKEKGETVIPLSKNTVKYVYAVFIKKMGSKYDYKVYNSKYTKGKNYVWQDDKYLDY